MTSDAQAQLIHEIGTFILSNSPTEGHEWEKLALVVEFDEGAQGIYGFYYDAAGSASPAAINDFIIVEKAAELRQAMSQADGKLWQACLMQLVRSTSRFVVTFEYDDAERWHVTAHTLAAVKQAIHPPDNL